MYESAVGLQAMIVDLFVKDSKDSGGVANVIAAVIGGEENGENTNKNSSSSGGSSKVTGSSSG